MVLNFGDFIIDSFRVDHHFHYKHLSEGLDIYRFRISVDNFCLDNQHFWHKIGLSF